MRIDSSNIGMESARSYISITRQTWMTKTTSGTYTGLGTGTTLSDDMQKEGFKNLLNLGLEDEAGEELGNSMLGLRNNFGSVSSISKSASSEEQKAVQKIRSECVQYLFKLLFTKWRNNKNSGVNSNSSDESTDWQSLLSGNSTDIGNSGLSVTTINSSYSYYHSEEENTSFSTTGSVITSDGRQIDFNLSLAMSRSFKEAYEENYSTQYLEICDPLVINLDSEAASLSDQKFYFDIDADGNEDEVSQLENGSGYLALDKNEDGTINDGSELFGTASGNGFADLAKYDTDENGWIDENDEIWDKLLIWSKDENGEDTLYKLEDKGVGAINLQNVSTNYALNSEDTNDTNGFIRKTGIFLYENGNVGTVQHVDLVR